MLSPAQTVTLFWERETVGSGLTVMARVAVAVLQAGVVLLVTVTVAVPLSVGVPLMTPPL